MNQDLQAKAINGAQYQAGVLTRSQLLDLGFKDGTIRSYLKKRQLRQVAPGIYNTVTGDPTLEAMQWAAHLRCGPDSFLYGDAALAVWGLATKNEQLTVAIPHSARRVQDSWLRVVRVGVPREIRHVGLLPVEAPADALIDATQNHRDFEKIQNIIVDAVQKRIVRIDDLEAAIESRRIPHRKIFENSIALLRDGQTTRLEINGRRKIFSAHGLPKGHGQAVLEFEGQVQCVDLYFPKFRLIVEFDGRMGHDDAAGKFRDMHRDNRAEVNNHSVLRFGWNDVQFRPCEAAVIAAKVLASRGWKGVPLPCRNRFCAVL